MLVNVDLESRFKRWVLVWIRSLDRPCLVAKGSNQVKSKIRRCRSLRLDSALLGPGDQDEAYLGDKFASGKLKV